MLAAPPARASTPPIAPQPERSTQADELPAMVKLVMRPTKGGMFLYLPSIDTDPNSGVTAGIMPVWVVMAASDTVRRIYVTNLTYNPHFGVTAGCEVFSFLSSRSNLHTDLSFSQYWNREVSAAYSTVIPFKREVDFHGHVEYSRDGSKRFFGFGPNSAKSGESNYTLDTINYRVSGSVPLREGSPFNAGVMHAFMANKVGGSFPGIPDTIALYPTVVQDVAQRHHNVSFRGFLNYDTRDSPVTTSRGTYAETFIGMGDKSLFSQYDYYRYGMELKHFRPTIGEDEREPRFISASRVRFENLVGTVPFWLMPNLGGKYSHRGYGEGRYIDQGMFMIEGEQRCRLHAMRISGVMTSFWLDPFLGVGTVFPELDLMQAKYFHPVVGAALRVVGRPQIVGSADFGYGQEGLKVFLDIDYSF